MSTYVVYVNGSNVTAGIKAVTYEVRIAQIQLVNSVYTAGFATGYRYVSSTLSGGTSATPVPLRQGAPAASATAIGGGSVSGSGSIVGLTYISYGATDPFSGTDYATPGSSTQLQTPLTLTIAPGSVFWLSGLFTGVACLIYFEELRLAGSY